LAPRARWLVGCVIVAAAGAHGGRQRSIEILDFCSWVRFRKT
jgi:hypothetical protein